MRRHLALLATLALLAAGCTATAGGEIKVTSATNKARVAKVRALEVKVIAPGVLAGTGAQILTDGGAGLIKGGQILTDGGAGLITRGDALAAPAFAVARALPGYALRAAVDQFKPVKAAGVQAVGLDGKAIGKVGTTDEDGGAKLGDLPAGKALSVIAAYKVGDKVYRQAATVGADAFDGTLYIDPINTMVEARVRDLLGGKAAPTITNARLKRVWGICNQADITVAPEDLEAGRSLEDITAALNKAWKAAIDAKVTSADEKEEIASFIADLTAAGQD